jgi:hypothetical protein
MIKNKMINRMDKKYIKFIIVFLLSFIISNDLDAQFANRLIKQNKFELKWLPSFASPDGIYLYINDVNRDDSIKTSKTDFFAIERINMTDHNKDSIKSLNIEPKEFVQIGKSELVQSIEDLKKMYTDELIAAFKIDKRLKSDKEMSTYFKTKSNFSDYGMWYNLIETRRALGRVFLDNTIKIGDRYLYFITRVFKDGTYESAGLSYAIPSSNGNYLLPHYKPYVSKSFALDSSLNISWKVPVNKKQVNNFLEKLSKKEDYLPIPFGEFNVRGSVYLLTSSGWEKTGTIFPNTNTTSDTLMFNYIAKATPEKIYKIFLQIEDEVHNKGNESDTATIFVVSKNNLPFITKTFVKDTINGIQVKWNSIPNKPYIESIEISKSELNTQPIKIYVSPNETSYIDYDVKIGKTYVYSVKTIFHPSTNLKQQVGAEGVGKLALFTKPLAPTNLIAKHVDKDIHLSWENDSIPGFYGFHVFRGTSYNQLDLIAGPIFEKEYMDTALYLSGKSTYYYAIQAQNLRQAFSDYSNRVAIMPKRPYHIYKPKQIDYFYANNTLQLKWNDVSLQDSYVNGYILQRKSVNEKDFTTIARLDLNQFVYTDSTVRKGSSFAYRVACTTVKGDTSEFTEPLVFTANKLDVSIVSDYTVRSISDGIEIALPSLVYDNRKAYNIYRKEFDANTDYTKIATLASDEFIFIDKKVVMGKSYLYAISVVEIDGREGKLSDDKAVKRD